MHSRNIVFSILFFLFFFSTSFSQQMSMPGREIVCPADPDHHEFYLAPPKRYLNSSNKARTSSTGGANFVVTYNGFSEEAQIAFQKAVDIWSSILNSDVTIYIDASWEPLGQGVLGSAGPGTLYRDFENAPLQNTWYCVALAEKIARKELNESGSPDITSRFNSSFDWYFGTDGSPGLKYDLVTVVLHEIGHGLGFAAYGTDVSGSNGSWDLSAGFAGMYSPYIVDGEGVRLLDLENGSAVAGDYLESNDLYLDNELVVLANNNVLPKIYAPTTYDMGSSISHWDDATFDGTDNALMTHAVAAGEAMHDPGINTLSVFADMGWIVSGYNHQPNRITNKNEPFIISADIFSDTTISSSDLEVHYFYEGADDTIIVAMNEISEDNFEISIDLEEGNNSLSYYISGLSDDLNRSYTSPPNIANGWYSVSLRSYLLLDAPYTISDGGGFEANQEHFSASSTSNSYKLWELGVPSGHFAGLTESTVWETNLEGPIGKPAKPTDNLLYSQFFDLSDITKDYVLRFDYAMDVHYDGRLSVIFSTDSSKTKTVLGVDSRDLGANWYDDESYFGSTTLDSDGNLEIRTVEYPLYELVGNKPLIGFSFYVDGLYSADSVYDVNGAMIDNFEVIATTPKARFYALEYDIFPGSPVEFHYASNGAESFEWDFGDGATSSERNPIHVYEDGGSYDVTLTIQYPGGGTDTHVREDYIKFIDMKESTYTLENGGDFETNEDDFVARNISGTKLTRGKSSIVGKAGTRSGDNAWVFGIEDATYVNDSEAYLYTSLFDFRIIGNYTLSFYANYSFENEWDGFVVEYSTDLGASWERLNEDVEGDWYDVISDPSAVFGSKVPIFSGTTDNQFVLKSTDVSFLGGATDPVVFRFLVMTDAAELDVGLALDDFSLTGPLLGEVVADLSGLFVLGDEGCEGQTLEFTSNSTGSITAIDWDFGEQATPRTASGIGPHQVAFGVGESAVLMTLTDIDGLTTLVDTLISTGEDHEAEITSVNNNNGSFTLTASDGDTFLWYFDEEVLEGITTQEYTTFENGEYIVEIAKGSCVRTSSIERLTVAGLSLANSDVNIAPNPVSTELLIQNSTQYQNAELRLYDLSGKLVLKKSFDRLNEDIKVSLSGVENGIYLVQVIFDQKYLYGSRLIKE